MEVITAPSVVVHPHALLGDGRILEATPFRDRETLGDYIKRTGVFVPTGPVAVWHNGCRVPDALWRRLIPRAGDMVVIRARMLGGGGDSSKVLRTVAMIALVVATNGAFGWQGLGAMVGTATGIGTGLASAGLMIGGAFLITALLPAPKATAVQLGTTAKYESSPTYSISGGRNRMRPWEPMMVIFGRHKVVPDAGGKHYTEYVGDDMYLNQIFHFGLQAGAVSLSDFRIGNTPVSNYQGVQLQVSGADGKLTMFPGNVDTLQGFVLQSGTWVSRTTPIDTNYISVELASSLFYVRDDAGIDGRQVQLRIQYRPVGGAWTDIGLLQDATYATHYWSLEYDQTSWYASTQYSYGSTNYADHYEGEQGLIQSGDGWYNPDVYGTWRWKPHPFQLGQPWQGIAPDPLLGYSSSPGIRMYGARQEPTRQTVGWAVSTGQYEVRVLKESPDIKNQRESNETAVGQILCYQPDTADYTGQLRVAMRIKATGQLNGPVDELSAIAEAYCQAWNGSSWAPAHTRNPADWYAHFVYGRRMADGTCVYGANVDENQIDYDAIKEWRAFCVRKGLTFDYVLDRAMSADAMLNIIARAGRATKTHQTGKHGVVWDEPNRPHIAMIGPFNIKPGTFRVEYINDETPDEIVGTFFNGATWGPDEVRVAVPGATTRSNPLQLDLDGFTDAATVGREVNLIAASQVWHRRRTSWEMDIEGMVAHRGDVVQITHDLTEWGYSGRLMVGSHGEVGGALPVMKLSRFVPSGGSGIVELRAPDGRMKIVNVVSAVGDVDTLTITTSLEANPDTGETKFPMPGDAGYEDTPEVDWAWSFDPLAIPGRRFKVTSTKPAKGGSVKFTAVDDDPGYYASENNPYAYTPPRDGALLGGVVFAVTFSETIANVQADITEVTIGWSLSRSMSVDVAISINGIAQPGERTSERQTSIQAHTRDVVAVTVTPISATGRGTPKAQSYTVQGLTLPLPTLTGLTNVFRDGLTVLHWDRVTDIRNPDYEVRIGESWQNGRAVGIVNENEMLALGNGLYWVAAHFSARGFVTYGQADSLLISGATLVRNVIIAQDEAPGWTGTASDGAYIHEGMLTLAAQGDILASADILAEQDILWLGGPAASGIYTNAESEQVDIGYVSPVLVDFDIAVEARNITADILSSPDILAIADILNGSDLQKVTVTPQIRSAVVAGEWTEWRNYVPGTINARYFDVRLLLATSDPLIIPFVTKFLWTIDVDDLTQQATNVAVPSGGMRITYPREFHTDTASPQVTLYDAVNGDWAKITNADRTGFDVQIFNLTTPKAGVINHLTQAW